MDVTPLIRQGQQVIQGYAGAKFKVSGLVYEGPIIVGLDSVAAWDAPESLEALTEAHFQPLIAIASEIDVVLLGAGKTMKFLPAALKKALKDKGLSVDVMDTGAACRTYNVLMAEGRRVAAALLPTL